MPTRGGALAASTAFGVAAIAAPLALAPCLAHASADQNLHDFNLPALPLADSLRLVGSRAGVNVAFDPAAVRGKTAPALRGSYSVEQALTRLAAGAGLRVRAAGGRSYLLVTWAGDAIAPSPPLRGTEVSPGPAYQLSEVMVLAQRRFERLQDVPLSVTALSAETLAAANVETTVELPMVTPGLQMVSTGIYVQPTIRGVGSIVSSPGSENNVATYVDGAYQQSARGAVFELPDVELIEVLKGPQGTLFGRNATGGAILIHTLKPSLEAAQGRAAVSYGAYGAATLKGFASVPIVEGQAALSLSGLVSRRGAWKHALLDLGPHKRENIRDDLLRAKLRFVPWQGADFTLTGLYDRRRDGSVLKTSMYRGNNISRAVDPSLPIAARPYDYAQDVPPWAQRTQKSIGLHGDVEFGPGTFSTTSYADENIGDGVVDVDGGATTMGSAAIPSYTRNVEQELVYTTRQLGRFRAVAGLFYYSLYARSGLDLNHGAQRLRGVDKASSYAAFGEATYDLTARLALTTGLRYTEETRSGAAAASRNAPLPPTSPVGRRTWQALTPRVSALFKATDQTNLYATYSEGFTSGLFNSTSFQPTPADPERIQAFEVGIKSAETRRLSWNAAAFHYDYRDLQVFALNQQPSGLYASVLSNAARAKIYGLELNGAVEISDALSLVVGATYLHARYASFPAAQIQVPTGAGGNRPTAADASGATMIRSPTWTGNLTANYRRPVGRGLVEATAALFLSSEVFQEFGNRVIQRAYALANANLSWRPYGGGLRLSLWGKNLTDVAVITSTTFANNYDAVDHTAPRTVGLSLQYDF